MKLSTDCSKCIFAKPSSSDNPCSFYIVDAIKDIKKVTIKNDFYYINEYVCKYGFSKDKLENLKKEFPDTDLVEYIKYQTYIKYYLVINNLDNNVDISDICEKIKQLIIKPKGVSILIRKENMPETIKLCSNILGDHLLWRLHNFFDEQVDFATGINISMSTNNHLKESNFLWIINDSQLDYMIENKCIEQINHIVNVDQPEIGIFKSKTTTDLLSGIFLTKNNYMGLTKNIAPILNLALQKFIESDNINIITYDQN